MTTEVTIVPRLVTIGTDITSLAGSSLLDVLIVSSPSFSSLHMGFSDVGISPLIGLHAFHHACIMESFVGVVHIPGEIRAHLLIILAFKLSHGFHPKNPKFVLIQGLVFECLGIHAPGIHSHSVIPKIPKGTLQIAMKVALGTKKEVYICFCRIVWDVWSGNCLEGFSINSSPIALSPFPSW
jgi:hypothetical protein